MVVAKADGSRPQIVDFSMIAPAALDPADYPLAGGTAQALFSWPAVKEDRNLKGYPSIAVPGQVEGMRLALERFGTIGWRQALGPAIALAERGLPLDWYSTLQHAVGARELAEFPTARPVYLPDGLPPVPPAEGRAIFRSATSRARCAAWPRPAPVISMRGSGGGARAGSEGGSRLPLPICAAIAPRWCRRSTSAIAASA
jgi:gamma-glutamyltranspeptidase/glutathione hydrolase